MRTAIGPAAREGARPYIRRMSAGRQCVRTGLALVLAGAWLGAAPVRAAESAVVFMYHRVGEPAYPSTNIHPGPARRADRRAEIGRLRRAAGGRDRAPAGSARGAARPGDRAHRGRCVRIVLPQRLAALAGGPAARHFVRGDRGDRPAGHDELGPDPRDRRPGRDRRRPYGDARAHGGAGARPGARRDRPVERALQGGAGRGARLVRLALWRVRAEAQAAPCRGRLRGRVRAAFRGDRAGGGFRLPAAFRAQRALRRHGPVPPGRQRPAAAGAGRDAARPDAGAAQQSAGGRLHRGRGRRAARPAALLSRRRGGRAPAPRRAADRGAVRRPLPARPVAAQLHPARGGRALALVRHAVLRAAGDEAVRSAGRSRPSERSGRATGGPRPARAGRWRES